jgi:tetraacyldisaccharide 4'-kinase
VILRGLGAMYGAAALWRRRSSQAHPDRRRRLARPVISVGNLRVGGTGKTPVVGHVARLLVAAGERPSVLSRGYARTDPVDGVTVVSDGDRVLAGVGAAGDEPLMLARALPGVPVLVGESRYLSGRLAERRFGATVHLLDDGFQHFDLARDLDLLITSEDDLRDAPLPAGRLREPLAAASAADAAIVDTPSETTAERVARALRVDVAFRATRAVGSPLALGRDEPMVLPSGARVFGVAGIARPERFFDDLRAAGWQLAGTMAFPDHHSYTAGDVARIGGAARLAAATAVLTTEKDAARLESRALAAVPFGRVPLVITVEPAEPFRRLLLERLAAARREPAGGGA